MCIFGSHPEKTNHCQLETVTKGTRAREHEEIEIAELNFRQHCAVACVNGEFDLTIFPKSNIDKKKLREQHLPSLYIFVNLPGKADQIPVINNFSMHSN